MTTALQRRRLPLQPEHDRLYQPSTESPQPAALHQAPRRAEARQSSPRPRGRRRRLWRRIFGAALCVALVFGGTLVFEELRTSEQQAYYLTRLAGELRFPMAPGPSPFMRFPIVGPYDEQLGYTRLPDFLERLSAGPYLFEAQARLSPRLQQLIDRGIFPIYREKTQTGLRIVDRHGREIYTARYPERIYTAFEEIPALIVQTLLFLENRELLDTRYPHRNPAVEWDRFAKALLDVSVRLIKKDHDAAGGSTLATQLEKFRHSPDGRTTSGVEKLRQMASASLRAYLHGDKTLTARRQIVVDYLNALPLAAMPGYGEVRGLGDGLWTWYAADFAQVNQVLAEPSTAESGAHLQARALAYKQVLSLLIALRRPSFYLEHPDVLNAHTDRNLSLVAQAGLIAPALRDAVVQIQLQRRPGIKSEQDVSFLERKAVNAVRTNLLNRLGIDRLYDLDRLDLTVHSTLDAQMQEAITAMLRQLHDPAYVEAAGLQGHRLLDQGNPANVAYSVILYERTPQANVLRVHTDTVDQPFDVNQGMQLDLGSTAKLRTLVTYLEVIAQLHSAYADLSRQELLAVQIHPSDRLTRWAVDYLTQHPKATLLSMLNAAMERPYSANPAESFFTGGGLHTFANFDRVDDHKVMPVREAFRHSVNLVFIRLMRDLVYYSMYRVPGATVNLLEDRGTPQREQYLRRFIDQEGQVFVHRFYRKYAGKNPEDMLELLLAGMHHTPERLATVYGAIEPQASFEAFTAFMHTRLPQPLPDKTLDSLYERYASSAFTLADRGYLTRTHPLELWVVSYLRQQPHASRQDITVASTETRQEVYQWLFKTHRKHAQDRRIRTMLEAEAFLEIHRAWQRLGYPFSALVPSYATAIGSSGDRPRALAELMGILVNDGIQLPTVSVEQLHFAADTPYETRMGLAASGKQVLPPEVAAVVQQALFDVVEYGTARRVHGVFQHADGTVMPVGGKTGTGDHRNKTFASGGRLLEARAVSRAATFVFMIDHRFFGTITAYVPGPEAAHYRFTSALPAQVLKLLAPILQPLLQPQASRAAEHVSPHALAPSVVDARL